MKAKELMIGDWVLVDSKPTKVDNVDADSINTTYIYNEVEDYIEEEKLSPIPLTAEILEKNGLWEEEWDDGDLIRCGNNGKKAYRAFHAKECYFVVKGWSEKPVSWRLYNNERMEIHFVHELQHALRLCGLNGLADNFKV